MERGILKEEKQVIFENVDHRNTIAPYSPNKLDSADPRRQTLAPKSNLSLDLPVSKFGREDDLDSINERESNKPIDLHNLEQTQKTQIKDGELSIKKEPTNFKVMHWNVMSDLRAQKEYKGKINDQILASKSRIPLITAKIKSVDPDVFGICDMDAGSYLSREIAMLGYSEFTKSKDKLSVSIFYKKSVFESVSNKEYQFLKNAKKEEGKKEEQKTDRSIVSNPPAKDSQEYFLMSHLKLKSDASKQIIFVQTYIQEDSEFKLLQLNKFLKKKLESNVPILISGTFN